MKGNNSSYTGLRLDLLRNIDGVDSVVLDVGCATGVNGKYLLEKGMSKQVYGIEYDKNMAEEASLSYSEVFVGDLDDSCFIDKSLKELPPVDYIIFGDVLEHLRNPERVLKSLSVKLRTNGKIIISLPNVGHLELFIQVYLKGTWPRNTRGIFDKTHLSWFTCKDAVKMINNSDLQVLSHQRVLRSRDPVGSKFNLFYKIIQYLKPDLVTFQNIYLCGHVK